MVVACGSYDLSGIGKAWLYERGYLPLVAMKACAILSDMAATVRVPPWLPVCTPR